MPIYIFANFRVAIHPWAPRPTHHPPPLPSLGPCCPGLGHTTSAKFKPREQNNVTHCRRNASRGYISQNPVVHIALSSRSPSMLKQQRLHATATKWLLLTRFFLWIGYVLNIIQLFSASTFITARCAAHLGRGIIGSNSSVAYSFVSFVLSSPCNVPPPPPLA